MKHYSGIILYGGRRYCLGSERDIKREVLDVYEIKTDAAGTDYLECLYAIKDEDPEAYVLLSAINGWKHLAEELMAEAGYCPGDVEARLVRNGLAVDKRQPVTNPEPF